MFLFFYIPAVIATLALFTLVGFVWGDGVLDQPDGFREWVGATSSIVGGFVGAFIAGAITVWAVQSQLVPLLRQGRSQQKQEQIDRAKDCIKSRFSLGELRDDFFRRYDNTVFFRANDQEVYRPPSTRARYYATEIGPYPEIIQKIEFDLSHVFMHDDTNTELYEARSELMDTVSEIQACIEEVIEGIEQQISNPERTGLVEIRNKTRDAIEASRDKFDTIDDCLEDERLRLEALIQKRIHH